ncbi:hypothetical protein [Flavobacterium sandaracinum]|uniref:Uncharacterized protein n=1 Tax=Flavobacterium sandaracinum TaxID=2541733 RepID=A0A4R5CV44_9FLAO|nr:hypothetical protein [Flavobacterium sandaracinum]TDE03310.1 hypothetical protein E0F91_11005 [Flavobacterium sandaracinum]
MGNSKIVLFEEDERSLNYKFEKFADRLNSTEILSLEYDKDKFLNDYEIVGQEPEIGSVYYKHPSKPNCYVNSSLGEYFFMQEKIEVYGKIAQLLGATGFEATVVLDSQEKKIKVVNGDIQYQVVKIEGDRKEEQTKKIIQSLQLNRKITIEPHFDKNSSYNKACEFLKSNNFTSDPSLNSLLESRNPDNGSVTQEQTIKIELTSEYNELLEISAGLEVMKEVFKLNMSFSEKFESIKKVNLDMKIYF